MVVLDPNKPDLDQDQLNKLGYAGTGDPLANMGYQQEEPQDNRSLSDRIQDTKNNYNTAKDYQETGKKWYNKLLKRGATPPVEPPPVIPPPVVAPPVSKSVTSAPATEKTAVDRTAFRQAEDAARQKYQEEEENIRRLVKDFGGNMSDEEKLSYLTEQQKINAERLNNDLLKVNREEYQAINPSSKTPLTTPSSEVTPPPVAGAGAEEAAGERAASKAGLRGVEKKALEASEKKVATQAASAAGKKVATQAAGEVAAKATAQVGAKAAATAAGAAVSAGVSLAIQAAVWLVTSKKGRKVLGYVLIGLAALIMIPVFIFVILTFARISPSDTPNTASEKAQADTVAGLFGSATSLRKSIINDTDKLVTSLKNIELRIDKAYSGEQATNAHRALDTIVGGLNTLKNLTDNSARSKLADTIASQITSFKKNYPELSGYAAVNGGYLTVPGVKEGRGTQCGYASVFMIILYYYPTYTNSYYYNPSTHSINASATTSCVSPAFINSALNGVGPTDWAYASSSQAGIETIKKSLSQGDPVIMYSKPGLIFSDSEHIFVIVGYDPSDDTFIVNNPNVNKVGMYTKKPNGKIMTSERIKQYYGDSIYNGHSFMIRSKYLK